MSEPRPNCLRCGASWVHRDDYAGLGTPHTYESAETPRPAPQPLDVERLIKALQSHPDHLTWTTIIRLHSDWLQAAYARLGSQEGSE